ncbi:hypothetical protein AB2881_29090, partial [Escherichia coli]
MAENIYQNHLMTWLNEGKAAYFLQSGQGSWVETCCTTRQSPPARDLNQIEVTQQYENCMS